MVARCAGLVFPAASHWMSVTPSQFSENDEVRNLQCEGMHNENSKDLNVGRYQIKLKEEDTHTKNSEGNEGMHREEVEGVQGGYVLRQNRRLH